MVDATSPWKLYDTLIEGVPDGVQVTDYCLGTHWSYLDSECGMGVSFTTRGGAKRTDKRDLRGLPLREVAELAKSWCFEEASIGIAALNAYGYTGSGDIAAITEALTAGGACYNIGLATFGNIVGGAVMVGVIYWISYRKKNA